MGMEKFFSAISKAGGSLQEKRKDKDASPYADLHEAMSEETKGTESPEILKDRMEKVIPEHPGSLN
jgi:hypothetical protein